MQHSTSTEHPPQEPRLAMLPRTVPAEAIEACTNCGRFIELVPMNACDVPLPHGVLRCAIARCVCGERMEVWRFRKRASAVEVA